MNNGTIFINAGVGFGKQIGKKTEMACPPLAISMDIAIPVIGFPVSLGLIAGYLSESGKYTIKVPFLTTETSTDLSALLVAGRIAYHLNFFNKIPRLDPYILVTIGEIFAEAEVNVSTKTSTPYPPNNPNNQSKSSTTSDNIFWFGVSVGARYFFMPNFGAFAELGFDTVQNFSFGVSFRL
ncbi:hypothetical protein [Treponema sp. R80B11-R83G3]